VKRPGSYQIDSDRGTVQCAAVVVATGGLSIPKIGATDFGYRLAQQFNIPLVERRPGLVPLTFDGAAWAPYAQLSGWRCRCRSAPAPKRPHGV
jgi:predicted flavoprotein YhiN